MNIVDQIRTQMAAGFQRKSATTCSRWASKYRIMGKPFPGPVSYLRHPWSMAMRDCDRSWVGPKAAQMGYTEVCLDRALFTLDIKKESVLYLLPKKSPDASDFSASRFDAALELSEHLAMMFDDVKNVGHKRSGSASLFIRGTMSKSGVKSLPVSTLILDEKDEMHQKNLKQAFERLSGQETKQIIEVSTPTIPEYGIDETFQKTNKQHFFFKCPSCGRRTEMTYPESVVVCADSINDVAGIKRSHYICTLCGNKLPHESKLEWLTKAMFRGHAGWEPTANFDADMDGFHIPQMYSFTISPAEFAATVIEAQSDPASEQELWNSKAGKPHLVADARVTDQMIDILIKPYKCGPSNRGSGIITMGVDQGKWLHCHIDEWYFPDGNKGGADINTRAFKKTLAILKVTRFEDLDKLMRDYQILQAVIDANPERREATKFMNRFWGHVNLCFYNRGIQGKTIVISKDQGTVAVDRTNWLDQSFSRFHRQTQSLPNDFEEEYRKNIKALVRVPELDNNGNPTAKYKNTKPDHYAHANNYSEIALPLALSAESGSDIATFL
jgi:hypothetical protein